MLEIGSTAWMQSITEMEEPLQLAPISPCDVVTLQFTSGSTGAAKAVPFTDRMLNERFMSSCKFHVLFAFQVSFLAAGLSFQIIL
jgi:acyl-CoA synthetase (AMP-forming)/AMP-acid ligase II